MVLLPVSINLLKKDTFSNHYVNGSIYWVEFKTYGV
jgi:hypothetical protein